MDGMTIGEQELLTRLGLALAIGLLVGVERGWRERDQAEGERTAGVRTFALIGLFGGVWGALYGVVGPLPFAAAFLAFAGGFTLFKWREAEREDDFGATTLVAALLTFALGALAVLGDMTAAVAAAVAMVALLAAKRWLHQWIETLTWEELRAALILLAMSFIALPVLPDRGYGPYDAINPHALWLMTIAIAGVSFMGYLAVRIIGARYGTLVAGVAGGLVSSTVATIDFARRARAQAGAARIELAGALAASSVMFLRMLVIVALFGPGHLVLLAAPLLAAALVLLAAALAFGARWTTEGGDAGGGEAFSNPFELFAVLRFAALLAVILVASKWLVALFGGRGAVGAAAFAGLADVDAITLSITQVKGASITGVEAAVAIFAAAVANSVTKTGIAIYAGTLAFGLRYGAVTLVAVLAAAAVLFAQVALGS
jgi:uncharacterized membrane protein (DUF4010 family)